MKPIVVRLIRGLAIALLMVFLAAAGAGAYAWVQLHRRVVTVRNLGPVPVTNVEASLGGQRATTPAIPPGREWRPPLTQRGTLILDLGFELGQRRCHHRNDYIEFEPGYRIGVEIRACEEVLSNYTLWPGSPFDHSPAEE